MSLRRQLPIDHQLTPRHECRFIRGQEQHTVGDVLGLPNPPQWVHRGIVKRPFLSKATAGPLAALIHAQHRGRTAIAAPNPRHKSKAPGLIRGLVVVLDVSTCG